MGGPNQFSFGNSRLVPIALLVIGLLGFSVPAQDLVPEASAVAHDSILPPTAPTPAMTELVESGPREGPEDIVIEVDKSQSSNAHKSLPLAMLYSVLIPGAGESYLNDMGHAKAFMLAEAGFWASLYAAFMAQDSYLQSSRNYASEFAGIDASGKSVSFLNTIASYRSYQEKQHRQDSYELAQILSGKRDRNYDIPMTPENDWDWGSSTNPQNTRNWKTFQSTLRYYRASKVAVSFAIGALALNRLASLANTLHVYKRTSAKGLSLQVFPEFTPESAGSRLSLNF